ncbi:MAG: hypothetical protein Q8Q09_16525 [Deltaproteobacteria bacterium]|nr:hypothetical protein [Deltaproteobacteria bacterium]
MSYARLRAVARRARVRLRDLDDEALVCAVLSQRAIESTTRDRAQREAVSLANTLGRSTRWVRVQCVAMGVSITAGAEIEARLRALRDQRERLRRERIATARKRRSSG